MSNEGNNGNNFQTLQFILGAITIISAVAFIAKLLGKSQADEEHDTSESAAASARQDLYRLIPPSFSDYVYRDWADVLDKSILRDATEDEDAVYSIFEDIKNDSDVAKLIEFFAHRREMFTTYKISLPQAISTKFSKSEKLKLNNILRHKKISYRFK